MSGGWWSGHKVVDPQELESRFSIEDSMSYLDGMATEELSDESLGQLDKVKEVMDLLPDTEADFVNLYYFLKRKQTDIAAIFDVSQPTVCYRLQRATARIKYLLSLPDVAEGEIEEAMSKILTDPLDVSIMLLMYETTCQSEVAARLGVSQGLVRHRFIRTIDKMEKLKKAAAALQDIVEEGSDPPAKAHSALPGDVPEGSWQDRVWDLSNQVFKEDIDSKVFFEMTLSGNMAGTSRELGISRHEVKRRYQKGQAFLGWCPDLTKYVNIFRAVHDNLNILREVQRPSGDFKYSHVIT